MGSLEDTPRAVKLLENRLYMESGSGDLFLTDLKLPSFLSQHNFKKCISVFYEILKNLVFYLISRSFLSRVFWRSWVGLPNRPCWNNLFYRPPYFLEYFFNLWLLYFIIFGFWNFNQVFLKLNSRFKSKPLWLLSNSMHLEQYQSCLILHKITRS